MKSVGNLTDFVREHMLEAFPVESRIEALIHHFDDLNRAHGAVLKAKDQIEAQDLWANPTDHHPNEVAHRIAADEIAAFIASEPPSISSDLRKYLVGPVESGRSP